MVSYISLLAGLELKKVNQTAGLYELTKYIRYQRKSEVGESVGWVDLLRIAGNHLYFWECLLFWVKIHSPIIVLTSFAEDLYK